MTLTPEHLVRSWDAKHALQSSLLCLRLLPCRNRVLPCPYSSLLITSTWNNLCWIDFKDIKVSLFLLPFVMNEVSLFCVLSRKASGFVSPRWGKSHQNNIQWRSGPSSLEVESEVAKSKPSCLLSVFCLLSLSHPPFFHFHICSDFSYLFPRFPLFASRVWNQICLLHKKHTAPSPSDACSKSHYDHCKKGLQASWNGAQNLPVLEKNISIESKCCT